MLVEAVEALGSNPHDLPLVGLVHMEVLIEADVGLAEHGSTLAAHVAGHPVARGRIAGHIDELAAAFDENRSAPNTDVATERCTRVHLLETADLRIKLPPL